MMTSPDNLMLFPAERSRLGAHGLALPARIVVPPMGLALAWLVRHLGLNSRAIFALHGDELGSPRDYVYRAADYFYTPAGVRAIVREFGLLVEVEAGFEVLEIERGRPPRRVRSKRWDLEDRT
jgi:hypothetical protein